jgi:hypothetical protein
LGLHSATARGLSNFIARKLRTQNNNYLVRLRIKDIVIHRVSFTVSFIQTILTEGRLFFTSTFHKSPRSTHQLSGTSKETAHIRDDSRKIRRHVLSKNAKSRPPLLVSSGWMHRPHIYAPVPAYKGGLFISHTLFHMKQKTLKGSFVNRRGAFLGFYEFLRLPSLPSFSYPTPPASAGLRQT